MKVLTLGLEWFPEQGGGLDRVYYDCIQYLPKTGMDLKGLVVGSKDVNADSGGIVQAFASPEASSITRYRALRRAVRDSLKQQSYDLVAAHFALYTWPVLGQLNNTPLVFHFHGPWSAEGAVEGSQKWTVKIKALIEQATYRRATSFIVLSKAFRDILHQQFNVPLSRINIVPGGVEDAYFEIAQSQTAAREKLQWPQDRFVLFAARRLVHRMGLENLIRAIAQVKKKHPDVLLQIAGKGPLADQLQTQIETLGLQDHVQLLGYVSDADLRLCYRSADLSIVPTIDLEGFGLVVVESLAAGTPVLGTPVGGIPEILSPLSANLLLPGTQTAHLVSGLLEVLSGSRQLPSSEACTRYAKNNYSWPIVAEKMKQVYQQSLYQQGSYQQNIERLWA